MKIFYKTSATATGGRSGVTTLGDGSLTFEMAPPGGKKTGQNPEQLFALGYAACFDSAMDLTAKSLEMELHDARTTVEVGIGQRADGGYGLDLDITAHLPGLSPEDAQRLIEASHQVCPYSHATRGNIDVRLHAITEGN
ncbi:organic hydroperoxide resistance protein [Antarcticimicrobium sediminis]|uniref:Organic hydroperoxide resistance protein n=1 Tax=Antarcticimicrobium sediminis TaxID=2546227 RepID=A0A4R5EJX1_9RHOB|nr:organic hydroperoxide resistance protein [Antarcticimicrobium sediminis]TDE34901.1 organic hydroperoxide resistance protein [Antarcticimicrobium sediminis]